MKRNILDIQVNSRSQRYDGLHHIGARAPLYLSLGSNMLEPNILEPRLQHIGAFFVQKPVFGFSFEHETR